MPTLDFSDFSGGLWLPESLKFGAPETGLIVAENAEYFASGDGTIKIRGRRGKNRLNTSTALTGRINGIHRLYRRSDGPFTLITFEDTSDTGKVHFRHDKTDNGILATIATDFAASIQKRFQFITWPSQDKAYFVNGHDGLRSYDGTTIAEEVLSGVWTGANGTDGNDIGPYLDLFNQRLVATKTDALHSHIYFSDPNEPSVWPAANQISIQTSLGGKMTGIRTHDEFLLLFKDTGLFRFQGDPEFLQNSDLVPISPWGCVAPYSIKWTPYGVMYLARDGLRITDGQSAVPIELSAPVRTLFVSPGTQATYTDAVASWSLRKKQYRIKLDAASDTHVLQWIDSLNGPRWLWSTATNTDDVYSLSEGEDANDNGRVFAGDSAGKFWELDVGEKDDDFHAITEWDMTIQLPFTQMHPRHLWGRASRFRTVTSRKKALNHFVRYDNKTATAESFSKGWPYSAHQQDYQDEPLTERGQHGQYVSVGVTFPDADYNDELHHISLPITYQGIRKRNRHIE